MRNNQYPKQLKLVIFDLDGTLVDAYHAVTDSINHMMRELGLPEQSLRKVKRSVGWGVDSLIRHFVEEDRADEALLIFRAHHDKRLRQKTKLLPGAKNLLAFLKRKGCKLAIASNRPTEFCKIILKSLKIDHYFDEIICGDKVKRAKPYPDIVRKILKNVRLKAEHAIYVGDMTVDIECAKRAKVFMAAVPTGSCSLNEIVKAKPSIVIRKLSDLKAFIEKNDKAAAMRKHQ